MATALLEELYVSFSADVIGLRIGFKVVVFPLLMVILDCSPVMAAVLTVPFCTTTFSFAVFLLARITVI